MVALLCLRLLRAALLLAAAPYAFAQVETVAQFNPSLLETPESIAIDHDNNKYVSLALTGEIRRIAADARRLRRVAGPDRGLVGAGDHPSGPRWGSRPPAEVGGVGMVGPPRCGGSPNRELAHRTVVARDGVIAPCHVGSRRSVRRRDVGHRRGVRPIGDGMLLR